jgi:outer membrane biosynthesis protein TonB
MADRVQVPFGNNAADTAVLLLAAAEELDMDQAVVGTGSGYFIAPTEVAQRAGLVPADEPEPETEPEPEPETTEPEPEPQPKKRPAKRTTKKK